MLVPSIISTVHGVLHFGFWLHAYRSPPSEGRDLAMMCSAT